MRRLFVSLLALMLVTAQGHADGGSGEAKVVFEDHTFLCTPRYDDRPGYPDYWIVFVPVAPDRDTGSSTEGVLTGCEETNYQVHCVDDVPHFIFGPADGVEYQGGRVRTWSFEDGRKRKMILRCVGRVS